MDQRKKECGVKMEGQAVFGRRDPAISINRLCAIIA
jgi:hypothetical protein